MPRFDLPAFHASATSTDLTVVRAEADRAFVDADRPLHVRAATETGQRWLRVLARDVRHGQVGLGLEARGTARVRSYPSNARTDQAVTLTECSNRRRTPHRWWEVSLDAVDNEGNGETLAALTFLNLAKAQGVAQALTTGDLVLVPPAVRLVQVA